MSLDGVESTYSAYASTNASEPHLLYGNGGLTYANHSLAIRNLGPAQASDQGATDRAPAACRAALLLTDEVADGVYVEADKDAVELVKGLDEFDVGTVAYWDGVV